MHTSAEGGQDGGAVNLLSVHTYMPRHTYMPLR